MNFDFNFSLKRAFAAAALVIVGIGGLRSFTMLKETERGVDYMFGKIVTKDTADLRGSGFSIKNPLVSVRKVSVDMLELNLDDVQTYTKDNQLITAKLSVFYRIPSDHILPLYRNSPDFLSMLEKTVLDAAKSALGSQEAQNVAYNREKIVAEVTAETSGKVKDLFGIDVVSVKMPNFDFEDGFDKAVAEAAQAKAVLSRKQTELEQQRVEKDKTIVNAQATQEQTKLQADAEAYSQQVRLEAEAKGKLAVALAEAQGFEKIAAAVGRENIDVYLQTSKWNGQNPQVIGGGNGSNGSTVVVTTTTPAPGPK